MNMSSATRFSTNLHPLLWITGISVSLLAIVGIASLTGLIVPAAGSGGIVAESEPATPQVVANAALPVVVAPRSVESKESLSPPSAARPEPTLQAKPARIAEATLHKAAKKKVSEELQPSQVVMLSPPHGSGVPPDYVDPAPVAAAPPIRACSDCGVIESVRQMVHDGESTGLGAIAGGILGGALASNLGKGNGRTLASVAAAIGGGMIGNQIEKSRHQTLSYQVSLRMEDGTTRLIEMHTVPSWRIGDTVRLVNGAILSPIP